MRYFIIIYGCIFLSYSAQGQGCPKVFQASETLQGPEALKSRVLENFEKSLKPEANSFEFKKFMTEDLTEAEKNYVVKSNIGHIMLKKSLVNRNVNLTQDLIELGVETELSDLILSVKNGKENTLLTMLETSPKVYSVGDLQPVLSEAIVQQNALSIKYLLWKGVQPNARDVFFLFHHNLEHLIRDKDIDVNVKGEMGWTALHEVIANAHFSNINSVVRSLLDHNADPNAKDNYGRTPIHMFANIIGYANINRYLSQNPISREDLEKRITILVDAGADMSARSKENETVMNSLIYNLLTTKNNNYLNTINVFLSVAEAKGVKLNIPFFKTANYGEFRGSGVRDNIFGDYKSAVSAFLFDLLLTKQYGSFKQMVSHIDNINTTDRNGNTFMHFLFARKNTPVNEDIVKFLVEQGADVNVRNKRGETPLDNAMKSNYRLADINYSLRENFGFKTGEELKKEDFKAQVTFYKNAIRRFFGMGLVATKS